MARLCILVGFALMSLTPANTKPGQAPTHESTQEVLTIVVRDLADDTPLPAVSVRIVGEQNSVVLATGLTDADGRCQLSVDRARAVAIVYERVGYVRRPETIALTPNVPLEDQTGRLLKSTGSRGYYQQAGKAIEAYARENTRDLSSVGWIIAFELERAEALSSESRAALESGLTPEVRADVTKNRELHAQWKKLPGTSFTAAYSRHPIFMDSDEWVGVAGDANQQEWLRRHLLQAPSLYDWDSANYRAALDAARRAVGSPLIGPMASQCVTTVGYCPMMMAVRPGTSCYCSTPFGLQAGIAH